MKVLVLGATGSVGNHLINQGIERGHALTALVRHPEKMGRDLRRVEAIVGSPFDPTKVTEAVSGQEAVVYAMGRRGLDATTFFSDSTRILLDAMTRHNVRRLVCLTGVGAGDTRGHGGFLYDRLVFPLFTKRNYEDKERQETLIRCSAVDWIIVRPGPFREGRPRGPFQVVTDSRGVTLRRIPRATVASFLLDQLTDDRYLRQTPFIGYSR